MSIARNSRCIMQNCGFPKNYSEKSELCVPLDISINNYYTCLYRSVTMTGGLNHTWYEGYIFSGWKNL